VREVSRRVGLNGVQSVKNRETSCRFFTGHEIFLRSQPAAKGAERGAYVLRDGTPRGLAGETRSLAPRSARRGAREGIREEGRACKATICWESS
jgi:hypothetical protein